MAAVSFLVTLILTVLSGLNPRPAQSLVLKSLQHHNPFSLLKFSDSLQPALCCDDDWSRMRYRPIYGNQSAPDYETRSGRSFHFNDRYLRDALGIPVTSYVKLTPEVLDSFVVVTAADLAYGYVALDAISTVQRHMPGRKIIFYDLGLHDVHLLNKITQICDVEYRKFNFTKYPRHVRDLDLYAWKPLAIHEVLREYPGVFWMDSSIRFNSSLPQSILEEVAATGGLITFSTTGHSNFAVTDPKMLHYLPSARLNEGLVQTEQREANSLLAYRTRDAYTSVIRWWVLCALQENCISSELLKSCDITTRDKFADCHRFDQSALNILLANRHNFDDQAYIVRSARVLQVKRNGAGRGLWRVRSVRDGERPTNGQAVDCSGGFETMKANSKKVTEWIPVKDW